VSQLVAQLFQMRGRMQKMMGAIRGKESPNMDDLMESIKDEEQVRAPRSTALRLCCFYACLLL
jgi:signal recognition particle subunit SRP54